MSDCDFDDYGNLRSWQEPKPNKLQAEFVKAVALHEQWERTRENEMNRTIELAKKNNWYYGEFHFSEEELKDFYQAAYHEGQEAMREKAAKHIDHDTSYYGTAIATWLRELKIE